MGDRANVYIKDTNWKQDKGVYLYTHWTGTDLPYTLQQALIRGKPRWSDAPYLTRIIFSEMIKNAVLDETGYGISSGPMDGEYRILFVDVGKQTVNIIGRGPTFSIVEYCELNILGDGLPEW